MLASTGEVLASGGVPVAAVEVVVVGAEGVPGGEAAVDCLWLVERNDGFGEG